MSERKLGGSMRYEPMGPGSPKPLAYYTVGGRSVHAMDASSGITKGTVRDMRPKRNNTNTSGKSAPFTIKRSAPRRPADEVGE